MLKLAWIGLGLLATAGGKSCTAGQAPAQDETPQSTGDACRRAFSPAEKACLIVAPTAIPCPSDRPLLIDCEDPTWNGMDCTASGAEARAGHTVQCCRCVSD